MAGDRQHYLSQFILRGFSPDGTERVWQRDCKTGKNALVGTKHAAFQFGFYSLEMPDGSKRQMLDDAFTASEEKTAPLLKKMFDQEVLEDDEKGTVAHYIAGLYSRTPDFKNTVETMIAGAKATCLQVTLDNAKRDDGSPVNLEEAKAIVERDTRGALKNFWLHAMYGHMNLLTEHLTQMAWRMGHSEEPNRFIFTDNPFVIVPPEDVPDTINASFGWGNAGVRKIVPLASHVCLLVEGLPPFINRHESYWKAETVEEINQVMSSQICRFLYASSEDLLNRYAVIADEAAKTRVGRANVSSIYFGTEAYTITTNAGPRKALTTI